MPSTASQTRAGDSASADRSEQRATDAGEDPAETDPQVSTPAATSGEGGSSATVDPTQRGGAGGVASTAQAGGAMPSSGTGGSGGTNGPTVEMPAEGCRVFPTRIVAVAKTGSEPTSTTTTTCSFDRAAIERTCRSSTETTMTNSSSGGSSTNRSTWSGLADALKHFVPIGRSTTARYTREGDRCPYTIESAYDAQGRLIATTTNSTGTGCTNVRSSCSEWDSEGRPLTCMDTYSETGGIGIAGTARMTAVYDDDARTITRVVETLSGDIGESTQVDTFDTDGWIISTDYQGTLLTTEITHENLEKETVCP
jgi:hypothetical protein